MTVLCPTVKCRKDSMEYLLTTPWSVSQLIDNFFEGRIAIPEIQRDLVWSSDQVKSLFDSIYQSYPCGSLILWEPRDRDSKLMREIIRPERLEYYKGRLPEILPYRRSAENHRARLGNAQTGLLEGGGT